MTRRGGPQEGRVRPAATLITGASSGIGAAVADRLSVDGRQVINMSLTRPEKDTNAVFSQVDLLDERQTEEAVQEAMRRFDIEGFVHCAGLPHMSPIEKVDLGDFRKITDLHLRAAMHCVSLLTPHLKQRGGGSIVLLGSRVSLGRVNSALYGAVKSATIGMARSLAVELAADQINVNVVSPGPVDTPMLRVYHPPRAPQTVALEASIPMGRVATVSDVANAVTFFLSEETRYVTGQNLFICGGLDIAATRQQPS